MSKCGWTEIEEPLIEIDGLLDALLDKTCILDILDIWGVEYSVCRTGDFTHRGKCPLNLHAFGDERTASFFVSEDKNKFYCFGCLEENELVWAENGLTRIKDLRIGDKIFDGHGDIQKITNVINKKGRNIISIGTSSFRNDPLVMTDDHICLYISKSDVHKLPYFINSSGRNDNTKFCSNRKTNFINTNCLTIKECEAKDLTIGDYVIYPLIKKITNNKNLYKSGIIKEYYKGPRNKRISSLPINNNTARLYGLWIAEGSVGRGFIRFSFSIEEKDTFAGEVVKILKDEFNLNSSLFIRDDKNICEVVCSNTDLSKLFPYWFGHGAKNKKIPIEFLSLNEDIINNLLSGIIDGDGNKDNVFTTSSKQLAYGAFNLMIQVEKCASLHKVKGGFKNGYNHSDSWVVRYRKKQSVNGFFETIGETKYYFSKIKKIDKNNINNINVVDISVSNTNTFLSKMGSVHNCNSGGNTIDFIRLYSGKPFYESAKWLLDFSKLTPADLSSMERPAKKDPNKMVSTYVYKSGIEIRDFLHSIKNSNKYDKWCDWADKRFMKLDEYLNNLEDEDWEIAKSYYDKIQKYLLSRK